MQLSCHACDTFKERFRPFQAVLEARLQLYQVSKQSHSDDSLVILARYSSCTLQQQSRPELGIGRTRGERPLTCLSGPPTCDAMGGWRPATGFALRRPQRMSPPTEASPSQAAPVSSCRWPPCKAPAHRDTVLRQYAGCGTVSLQAQRGTHLLLGQDSCITSVGKTSYQELLHRSDAAWRTLNACPRLVSSAAISV